MKARRCVKCGCKITGYGKVVCVKCSLEKENKAVLETNIPRKLK